MSLQEVYQLYEQIREHMGCLGHWQALTLALYSMGVVVAEKCIPSKVSEKCGYLGSQKRCSGGWNVGWTMNGWCGQCAAERGVGGY